MSTEYKNTNRNTILDEVIHPLEEREPLHVPIGEVVQIPPWLLHLRPFRGSVCRFFD